MLGAFGARAQAPADDSQRSAQEQSAPERSTQESDARRKLDKVRAEIRKISDEQRQTAAQRSDATAGLREQELRIAATAKDVRALDQKLAGQQDKLDQLVRQRDALEDKLKTQRESLAALLRSAYALGRNEELRLLLMQDDVDSIGRLLAYYGYFERARVTGRRSAAQSGEAENI